LFEGECRGEIALAESGQGGFGYDPVFFVPEYGATMAALPPEVKNTISHRARAVQAAIPYLVQILTSAL
jgi:XTP/dITP diphosphohydrolase